jgi:hypothetical protein
LEVAVRRLGLLMLVLVLVGCGPAPAPVSVYALQQGQVAPNTWVRVQDAVVTGTGLAGFWVADPRGGAHSGIWVEMDMLWDVSYPGVRRGARVDVTGVLMEFDFHGLWDDTVTEINGKQGQVEVTGVAPEPEPVTVPLEDLMDPVRAEPWEGVIIRVVGDFVVQDPSAGFGAWSVTEGTSRLVIQDSMVPIPKGLAPGERFCGFTGIWQYSFSEFKFEPRQPDDLCRP